LGSHLEAEGGGHPTEDLALVVRTLAREVVLVVPGK
jgi:hypothetical protein